MTVDSTNQGMRIRQWLSVLLTAAVLAGSPVRVHADAADDAYSLASGFYKRMRWDLASESFGEFLKKYPKHDKAASARLFLGLALVNQREYQNAREQLRQFAKDSPQNRNLAHALYRVAECSYLLDDLKEAEPELAAFITKFPKDPLVERALPYLADVQLRLNKPEPAAESFRKALADFPQGVLVEDCQFGLARANESLKKLPEAIQLYRQLADNPQGTRQAEALLNLGGRYFEDKNFAASAAAYGRLQREYPQNKLVPIAQLNQGYALFQGGQYEQALAQFVAASAAESQALEGRLWQGLTLKALRRFGPAADMFRDTYEAHRDTPQAENLLYHWADSIQRQGDFTRARELFLDLVKRWPQGELADDSLYFAALAAFDGAESAEAETLINRFTAEYPQSGLRSHVQVLRGRLLLAKDGPAAAIPQFEAVVKESKLESTVAWARYYLGFAQHQQGQDAEALASTDPLLAVVKMEGQDPAFVSVYLLRGACQFALGKASKSADDRKTLFTAAGDSATQYLERNAKGDQADRALAIRALAGIHAGLKDPARADLAALEKQYPESRELAKTIFEMAEVAFANEDWKWSQELFGKLTAEKSDPAYQARGLSGLGWSQYRQKDFAGGAEAFGQLLAKFPKDPVAAEAGFMQGRALQDAGKKDAAVPVYIAVLEQYDMTRYGYLAGLQAARLQGELKHHEEADAAYARLLEKYPKPEELDKVLDEWALMNYAAERFERSDAVFRRLIADAPDSTLADNARLSLAESDLVAGKIDEAAAGFRELQASPKSDAGVQQAALHQLVGIAVERQKWPDVLEFSRQLSERFPDGKHHWFAELHWAEAQLNMNEPKLAEDRLTPLKALQATPEIAEAAWFPQLWILLAEAQFRQKRHAAVAETVAEFRKAAPQSNMLYVADEILGRSLKAEAKFPQSRAAFLRVVEDSSGRLTETAAKSQFMIAETYLLENNYEAAEKEYLKVEILYKFPEWQAPAIFQAATCQEKLNRWNQAVKSYEMLIQRFPDNQYAMMAKDRLAAAKKKVATT